MKTYTKEELAEIINKHSAWARSQEGGQRAYLQGTDLRGAYLQGAYLQRADLQGAYLQGADLQGALNADYALAQTVITPDGDLIGWKKCQNEVIVKLKIPAKAKRSNATGRKCRAEFVKTLQVFGAVEGISKHNSEVIYRKGETTTCHKWNENRFEECSRGIHFFLTRIEAENYD